MKKFFVILLTFAVTISALAGCGEMPQTDDIQSGHEQDIEAISPSENDTKDNTEIDLEPDSVLESDPAPEPEDDRGISGFNGDILVALMENSFDIPSVIIESNKPEESAWRCISSLNQDGVKLAYQISLDEEKELIKASFSASSTTEDKAIVRNAADLYFYGVAIQTYDTSDKDTLVTWMEDTVASVDASGASTTIGDADFYMYSSGNSYYLDVSKNAGQNQDTEPKYTDTRGISGFDASTLIETLEVDFFNPDNDKTESWVQDANLSAHSETDGVQVDYYITVDDDNELYFAGFEVSRASESDLTEDELVDMASRYFLIPLMVKYDGSDAEKAISWLPEAFERIDTSEKSSMGGDLTVGVACFSVGYTDGIYTLIIDKQITP